MNEIDYINAYKGYRKWQKLVYGMIPCKSSDISGIDYSAYNPAHSYKNNR